MTEHKHKPQMIVSPSGDELVVISRSDYEALVAGKDDAEEDIGTRRIIADTDAAIAQGADVALPEFVWAALEAGESPIRVVRKFRALTQKDMEKKTGLAQGYLSEIENGTKPGGLQTMRKIAKALRVPVDLLLS
jgi:DNA-binding XRE family transcriptional regulator/PHD/YefM family antitoxin component YafN of YafNO toxin-antitoxin module